MSADRDVPTTDAIWSRLNGWRQAAPSIPDAVVLALAKYLQNASYGSSAETVDRDLYERRWTLLDDGDRRGYLDAARRDLALASLLLWPYWEAGEYERGCIDERARIAVDEQDFEASIRRDERATADAEWRQRARKHLCRTALDALRCIPDGEILDGCRVLDGEAERV